MTVISSQFSFFREYDERAMQGLDEKPKQGGGAGSLIGIVDRSNFATIRDYLGDCNLHQLDTFACFVVCFIAIKKTRCENGMHLNLARQNATSNARELLTLTRHWLYELHTLFPGEQHLRDVCRTVF